MRKQFSNELMRRVEEMQAYKLDPILNNIIDLTFDETAKRMIIKNLNFMSNSLSRGHCVDNISDAVHEVMNAMMFTSNALHIMKQCHDVVDKLPIEHVSSLLDEMRDIGQFILNAPY